MESVNELIYIGKIVKTHALKGQMLLDLKIKPDPSTLTNLYIGNDPNTSNSYSLTQTPNFNGERMILSLKGVTDIDQAKRLIGLNAYASRSLFDEEELENSPDVLIGFELLDENSNQKGLITNYYDLPNNPLLVIEVNKKEVLIPFHDDIIQEIDFEAKEVIAKLPDGLIEVYLNPTTQEDDEN